MVPNSARGGNDDQTDRKGDESSGGQEQQDESFPTNHHDEKPRGDDSHGGERIEEREIVKKNKEDDNARESPVLLTKLSSPFACSSTGANAEEENISRRVSSTQPIVCSSPQTGDMKQVYDKNIDRPNIMKKGNEPAETTRKVKGNSSNEQAEASSSSAASGLLLAERAVAVGCDDGVGKEADPESDSPPSRTLPFTPHSSGGITTLPRNCHHRSFTIGFRPARRAQTMALLRRTRSVPGAFAVRGPWASLREGGNSSRVMTRSGSAIAWTGVEGLNQGGGQDGVTTTEGVGRHDIAEEQEPISAFLVDTNHLQNPNRNQRSRRIPVAFVRADDIPVVEGLATNTIEHHDSPSIKRTCRELILRHCKIEYLSVPVIISFLLLLLMSLGGILLGVFLSSRTSSNTKDNSSSPSNRFNEIKSILESYLYSALILDVTSSPQHRALVWVADEDARSVSTTVTKSILQRFALATIYFATGGEHSWIHEYKFLSSDHECFWNDHVSDFGINTSSGTRGEDALGRYLGNMTNSQGQLEVPFKGVFCFGDHEQTVTHITMPTNNVSGILPEEIGLLLGLTHIGLWSNNLVGSIPRSIGNLEHLQFLILDENDISGTLPESLWLLSSLRELSVPHNAIHGSVPSSVMNLEWLEHINLGFNFINGTLPSVIGNLVALESMDLQRNLLFGTLPSELGKLTKLKRLYLDAIPDIPSYCVIFYELLRRNIPVGIKYQCDISEIRNFYLEGNYFRGEIPETLGNLISIEELGLARHALNGTISLSFQKLTSLKYLSLDYNMLTGTIPSELGLLTQLGHLSLWSNLFTGTIPTELGRLTKLALMSLFGNRLTGSLPTELAELSDISFLSFWSNELTGTVPRSYANMSSLLSFAVNNNSITGSLDFLCDRKYLNLVADCYGDSREVNCSCCNYCCSDEIIGDALYWFYCFSNI